jgi:trehalose 6-phosphate phosphatase
VTDPGWPALSLDRLEAVVFDTDGVLTDTARVHAAAWRRLLDEYLARRAARRDESFRPFEDADYLHLGELALQGGPVRWGGR